MAENEIPAPWAPPSAPAADVPPVSTDVSSKAGRWVTKTAKAKVAEYKAKRAAEVAAAEALGAQARAAALAAPPVAPAPVAPVAAAPVVVAATPAPKMSRKEAKRVAYLEQQAAKHGHEVTNSAPSAVGPSDKVQISFTWFTLHGDGTVSTPRRKRSPLLAFEAQDNSKSKTIFAGKLGEGMMTVTVITEDWEWTKAIGTPTFVDRKAVARFRAWDLRQQAAARRQG